MKALGADHEVLDELPGYGPVNLRIHGRSMKLAAPWNPTTNRKPMMKRGNLLAACVGMISAAWAAADAQIIQQSQVSFTRGSSGTWNADWLGKTDRTYFVQFSLDLKNWHFAPVIAHGAGLQGCDIHTENADKFFVRLIYTDDPLIDTLAKARGADFDADGISNAIEVENSGSNPYDPTSTGPDSDGDRLPDGWELQRFGNLDQNGYSEADDDGYTVFEERALGSDPTLPDQPFTDTDQDGMPDAFETAHDLSTSQDDSLDDADGDGIPNIFEYKNGSSPSAFPDKPPFDYIVDASLPLDDPEGKKYRRIDAALGASNFSPWDDVNDMPGLPPRPFQLILVKSGTYQENVYMAGIPTLLAGERGGPNGPVVIQGTDGNVAVHLESRSVLDSLVITHVPGQNGPGVEISYWETEPGKPETLARRRLVNCIIQGNTSVYGPGGIQSQDSRLTLDHCTVFANTGEEGATALVQSDGSLTLNNTIIWGNAAQLPATDNTQMLVTNGATLLTSESAPNIIGDPNTLSAPGWIDQTDPKLTPAGWLKFDSPAINAGGAIANTLTSYDLNGELRNLAAAPDIGADEYLDANGTGDGDGVPDWAEGQADDDGLTAKDEYELYGTDPRLADTDGDAMNDAHEVANDFNPLFDEDREQDDMSDAWEFIHGLDWQTDDSLDDKDGDRIPNLFEFKSGTSPVDAQDIPAITCEVNPATGDDDPDDNIYSTIEEALDSAAALNIANTDLYPIIFVRGGVHSENVYLSGIPILLLGELGSPAGPAEIRSDLDDAALTMESRSVVDGFVITHQPGATGSGLSVYGTWWETSQRRRLTNCIVRGNMAGGISAADCDLELVHCTVVGNSSTWSSPGISLTYASLHLRNSVVAGNTGNPGTINRQIDLNSESLVLASSSCPSFISDAPEAPISGWIVVPDPGLTSAGWVVDAYTPVVDSGGIIPATIVKHDLHGQLRAAGGVPDIGADEFLPLYDDPEGLDTAPDPSVDSDGDGIPDQWEIAHNLDPQTPNPASDLQDYLNESVNTNDLLIHTPLQ
ncbi:MAG: hypothetical protein V4733_08105 [Verrucomicrobiota bacterium]